MMEGVHVSLTQFIREGNSWYAGSSIPFLKSQSSDKRNRWGHSASSKIALTPLHFSMCDNLKVFYDVGFIVIQVG